MPPLSILIKPASSLCNLRCQYCFYHDVAAQRETYAFGIMGQETAGHIIQKALRFAAGERICFAFQGGEPTMAGLAYFRQFVAAVRAQNTQGSEIVYSIQTNGLLLNTEWADFLQKEHFLVGLSLDGDLEANRFRVDANGQNAFYKILNAATLLETHKVAFNILTVLTGDCAENAERIYRFFRGKGFRHLQFIPCLRPFGDKRVGELYMTVDQYADFLIRLFNLYVKDYVRHRYTSIRQFDNYVQLYLGRKPEQCGMGGHCTFQFVVEGNGNTYPCDFYCVDAWLLGNICTEDFAAFANSKRARAFIQESLNVPDACRACRYYPLCRAGGCKRSRADQNYCEAYRRFFAACLPLFRVFINELNA